MRERVKRIWILMAEQFALLSVELIIVLLLSIASVFLFLSLAGSVMAGEMQHFDDQAYLAVSYFRNGFWDAIMRGATFLGNRQFIVWPCIGVFVYFLFIRPHRWYSITVPTVALGSIGMNLALKWFFDRPRPVVEHMVEASGLSFPSGHAMFAFSFYGLLVYIAWRYSPFKWLKYTATVLLSILILLIGVSRTYLGVHYASDVLAGFAAGLLWLVLAISSLKFIQHRIRVKQKKISLEAAEDQDSTT